MVWFLLSLRLSQVGVGHSFQLGFPADEVDFKCHCRADNFNISWRGACGWGGRARRISSEYKTEWGQFCCLVYWRVVRISKKRYVTVLVLLMLRDIVAESWNDRGVKSSDLSVGLGVVLCSC